LDSEAAVAITTGAVNAMKANPGIGRAEALRIMFEQALKWVPALPENQQKPILERLGRVRAAGRNIGWGVGEEMADLEHPHVGS
jgi:hypothetical protein